MEKHFVPNLIIYWPPDLKKQMDTVGFIPVYGSVEELKKHHPDAQYREEALSGKDADSKGLEKIVPLPKQ